MTHNSDFPSVNIYSSHRFIAVRPYSGINVACFECKQVRCIESGMMKIRAKRCTRDRQGTGPHLSCSLHQPFYCWDKIARPKIKCLFHPRPSLTKDREATQTRWYVNIGANAEDMKECSLLACCPWLALPAFFIAPRISNTGVAIPTVSCPSQPPAIINQEIAPQPCQKAHSKANRAGDIFSIKIPSSQITWLCQIDIKLARIPAKCFFEIV